MSQHDGRPRYPTRCGRTRTGVVDLAIEQLDGEGHSGVGSLGGEAGEGFGSGLDAARTGLAVAGEADEDGDPPLRGLGDIARISASMRGWFSRRFRPDSMEA